MASSIISVPSESSFCSSLFSVDIVAMAAAAAAAAAVAAAAALAFALAFFAALALAFAAALAFLVRSAAVSRKLSSSSSLSEGSGSGAAFLLFLEGRRVADDERVGALRVGGRRRGAWLSAGRRLWFALPSVGPSGSLPAGGWRVRALGFAAMNPQLHSWYILCNHGNTQLLVPV